MPSVHVKMVPFSGHRQNQDQTGSDRIGLTNPDQR